MNLRLLIALWLFVISPEAFAQDRGTVTGTVADSTAAVLPGVSIVATNTQTGARYETLSTETGNYTISQLPVGVYELAAELPGFKRYVRQGITVLVAQTLRIDVGLEVGATTEEVTVTADAALLRTESAEVSTNVATERMNELPILGIGQSRAGQAGVRNPLAAALLAPGVRFVSNTSMTVNGMPTNTQKVRVEGQDATNLTHANTSQSQQSSDAIQEVAIQTSSFAAEYGQVGGGLFNLTMKSGTNNFHGSVYDYFVNEFTNAGTPYLPLNNDGRNPRERNRRNNYGVTLGGPVMIPSVYDGHNRTFFFFNFEQYRENSNILRTFTVPTSAYRQGDFSALLTGRTLGTDPLGRPIMEGTIYDIATERLFNGMLVRDPFPNNRIPLDRMDPVALKVQSFIPLPNLPGLSNNLQPPIPTQRVTTLASIKVDHNLSANHKLAFYHSITDTKSPRQQSVADGLPVEISGNRGNYTNAHLERLNYDWSISPTLLFHLGAGYQNIFFTVQKKLPDGFDALSVFGLPGQTLKRFPPAFTGLESGNGGVKNLGETGGDEVWTQRISGIASLSLVRNNHTHKFGTDWYSVGLPSNRYGGTSGSFNFSADQTGLGRIQNLGGGFVGFPYTSFLLGLVSSGSINPPTNPKFGRQVFALYAQDTWKVTPRLTLDYGLRWDYSAPFSEQYGRVSNFSPTVSNSQTGTPGGVIFEGDGPGHCGCDYAKIYKWAFGPRLGAAWQAAPRTVVRAGFGIVYDVASPTPNLQSLTADVNNPFSSPATGQPAILLKNGPPAPLPWPLLSSGLYPTPGTLNFGSTAFDPGAGRPARMLEWNLTVQREITANFAVEASYVGNRGVWWEANTLRNINANTPERLRSLGLNVTNPADFQLLRQPVNSAAAIARGFGPTSRYMPYGDWPTTSTVAQMLRPFPQFGNINSRWSPLGKTWYDALQMKATKRVSFGMDFTAAFAWQKELALGGDAAVNNVFDYDSNKTLSSISRPLSLVLAGNYQLPALNIHRVLSWAIRDWQIGTVLRYTSGEPIVAPTAQTQLNTVLFAGNSYANRVSGEPLYTVDLNCHCFDPLTTFVLNPKAWENPPQGQFSSGAAYYNDYRYQRRPDESVSLGRVFSIREGVGLSIRAEFNNVLNRRPTLNPSTSNASETQRIDPLSGNTLSGFGSISSSRNFGLEVFDKPREGTIIARIRF